jgi:hypothetical protein
MSQCSSRRGWLLSMVSATAGLLVCAASAAAARGSACSSADCPAQSGSDD